VTERTLDMVMFILLFFLTIFTQIGTIASYLNNNVYPKLNGKFSNPFSHPSVIIGAAGFFILIIALFIVFRHRIGQSKIYQKIIKLILGFWEGLKSLTQIKKPVLFIVYTFSIWILYFFMLYLCFFSLSESSSLVLVQDYQPWYWKCRDHHHTRRNRSLSCNHHGNIVPVPYIKYNRSCIR